LIARASNWTAGEVAEAVSGELVGDARKRLDGVSTDTRDALGGSLFVALAGERFDAHDFLGDALKAGAGALLVSRRGLETSRAKGFEAGSLPLVVVDDTLRALGDLAAHHRRRFAIPVVALTGSNGKTTTKEMTAAILAESKRVLKTEGNLNNLIGVPMTLLGLKSDHDAAVIEMGMNTPGEIARYAEIARPDAGMVINVGPAHIGMLGSLRAIAEAKGELYRGLDKRKGIAVVNADDPEVVRVAKSSGVERVRTFGRRADADVRLVDSTPTFDGDRAGQRIRIEIDKSREVAVALGLPGAHNAMNAAAAVALATALPSMATPDQIAEGLPKATRVSRRMSFDRIGPYLLVDDCYNANSSSMKAAIETVSARVAAAGGRFVALLGEMRELGGYALEEHASVGDALVAAKAALIASFGGLARPIAEAAKRAGIEAHHEDEDLDALYAWLAPRLRADDIILVKGSRGMKMERFIERLKKEHG
jgi:UDP-N-acetylmuramoyl-tripeptide--D-alanyl-D-alanine ligase